MGTSAGNHASNTPLTVAVTGASGFVGRRIVRALIASGHNVRALVRDRASARKAFAKIPPTQLSIIAGDVADAAALTELTKGASAVIHLVGILREGPGGQTFQKCHITATREILAACQRNNISRYLHMSALGVSSEGSCDYLKSKWEAERLVQASELDWTIFRPGMIHGVDGEFTRMAATWCRGKGPLGALPYFTRWETDLSVPLGPSRELAPVVEPVSVDDVATAFTGALTNAKTIGEIYNLVGTERLTWPDLLEFMHEHVPHAADSAHAWGIPGFAAAAGAKAAKLLGMGSLLPFDEGMALMGSADSIAELQKVRSHLGLEPKPFRATFKSYAEQL